MFRLGDGDGDGEPSVPARGRDDRRPAHGDRGARGGARRDHRAAPGADRELADLPPDATIVAPPRRRARRRRPRRAPARRPRQDRRQDAASRWPSWPAIGTGLYALSRQVYFIGTNDAGLVTLYRGVPYELPFGIDLYEQQVRERRAGAARSRARGASACSTTSGAAATTPRTCCARSSGGSCRADDRAHPRAVRADPGVAAGGGRLRGRAGHPHRGRSATRRSPTAPSSSACAWSRTCSSARGCPTPTPTCSRWPRCSPRSGSS